MASKNTAFLALFLSLNLVFFTLVSGCSTCPKPKPPPKPKPACPPPPHTPTPTPPSTPTPTPSGGGKCPVDTLKLGICANLLGGLLGAIIGVPPSKPCCSLIQGLVDAEAALCLCTAIKANVLGINLNIPLSLSLLLSACKKDLPKGFKCA